MNDRLCRLIIFQILFTATNSGATRKNVNCLFIDSDSDDQLYQPTFGNAG